MRSGGNSAFRWFEFGNKIRIFAAGILVLYCASILGAAAGGSSVEDLVGVFSIQKTIRLGSSGSCFDPAESAVDQLGPTSNALAADQAPVLMSFGLEPRVMMRLSQKSINLTAHIMDGLGGLSDGSRAGLSAAYFRSPSGKQTAKAPISPDNITGGGNQDGIYSFKVILPQNSEAGAWRLDNLTIIDSSGSSTVVGWNDLISRGFPAEFLVA